MDRFFASDTEIAESQPDVPDNKALCEMVADTIRDLKADIIAVQVHRRTASHVVITKWSRNHRVGT
jgi:hypothetical protein